MAAFSLVLLVPEDLYEIGRNFRVVLAGYVKRTENCMLNLASTEGPKFTKSVAEAILF